MLETTIFCTLKQDHGGGFVRTRFAMACILALASILLCIHPGWTGSTMLENFVDIQKAIPSAVLDVRYYGDHNFLGTRVDGYQAPKCLITKPTAEALAKVQAEQQEFSLTLKIYDCYRPQQAVDHFVRWAKDVKDTKTKAKFYPTVDKHNLFRVGYIAEKSGHSRGSTIDLTVASVPVPALEQYSPEQPLQACYLLAGKRFQDNSIDMGTGFDCFHELSHPGNLEVGRQQRTHRLLLKTRWLVGWLVELVGLVGWLS